MMIPANVRPHRRLQILFIGDIKPECYSHRYLKFLKLLSHQVITVCEDGDIKVSGHFNFEADVLPRLRLYPFEPDLVVFVESYPLSSYFHPENLRENLAVPSAFISVDTALRHQVHTTIGNYFDYVFISDQEYLEYFNKNCSAKTHWLQLACDPEVYRPLAISEIYDLSFVGTISHSSNFYASRNNYLKKLNKIFNFKVAEGVSDEETVKIYNSSKMIFNFGLVNGINARIYEALSCDKLLLTNRTTALKGVFADKVHLVFYDNFLHLKNLVQFYLNHPDKRSKISAQGHYKAWRHHTFYHRIDQFLRRIFEEKIYLA